MNNSPHRLRDSLLLDKAIAFLANKKVPVHRYSYWYLFGGITLFFVGIQFVTGILLLVYYSPTPNTAYESTIALTNSVQYGWIIRSLHHWSANLLIAAMLIHLSSTFFMKAYKNPREFTWVSGVLLMFLLFGFCFTGSLLPWDTTAYFATQIGTEIPRSTPIVGDFVVRMLRGASSIGGESLKRFFALHVSVLPLVTMIIILLHLILNQIQGTSSPQEGTTEEKTIPFYPSFFYKDLIAWSSSAIILVWLALLLPIGAGVKADPYASAPVGIKPEWYFLPLYQTLRVFPATILSLNGEMIVNVGTGLIGISLVLLPFIDRGIGQRFRSLSTFCGAVLLSYLLISTLVAAFY